MPENMPKPCPIDRSDAARLSAWLTMSCELHRHALEKAGPDEVPYGGPAEIVTEHREKTRLRVRFQPRPSCLPGLAPALPLQRSARARSNKFIHPSASAPPPPARRSSRW